MSARAKYSNAAGPRCAGRRSLHRGGGGGERGFALLLVFAMAAIVAITLYLQLPRVAFEAQRDRETTLVERGRQYQRAIELYVRKNNRYPARIDDLERDRDQRYLRRRYKDPMTGKDEWRLIHINAAGQLEDSLIEKPKPGAEGKSAEPAAEESAPENMALQRRRPGDEAAANAPFPGSGERGVAPLPEGSQGIPATAEGDTVPLLDASGNVIERMKTEAQAQEQQAAVRAGLQPDAAGGSVPGQQGSQNASGGAAAPPAVRLGPGGIPIIENPAAAVAGTGNPQTGGAPAGSGVIAGLGGAAAGGARPGGSGTPGQGPAQKILEGLLMRPRENGLAGLPQQRGIQPAAGAAGLGAGIAGVASKLKMKGILVYDEQESIDKWEFVYDARKAGAKTAGDPARSGARAGQPGTPSFGGGSNSPGSNQSRSRPSANPGGFPGAGQPTSGQRGAGGMGAGGRR